MEGSPMVSALMARPEVPFEAWEAFETRPVSAGNSIPGIDGLPSRSLRRPRSSTRLQAEVEMSRAQAQLSELRTKLSAESREVDRLQQCLDAAHGEASHQRSLAQAAQVEVAKLHQRLAASAEETQAHRSYAEAAQAVQEAAGRAAGDSERRLQAKEAEIAELTMRLRRAESSRAGNMPGEKFEQKQLLEEKAAYAAARAAEQGEAAARAERRLRESEEKCRKLQDALDDLSNSASVEIDAAATRVRDLEVELERWQSWAGEEVARAQHDAASQLSLEQQRVAELGQELPRVRERLADAEAQLRAKDWDLERIKTEAAAKAAELLQQLEDKQREQERHMTQYKAAVDAELHSASSYALELENKLGIREQELERQLAAAWAKAAEREAQLETADQQLHATRAREKQLESRFSELSKDVPKAQDRIADLEGQLQTVSQQRGAMHKRTIELEMQLKSKERELEQQVAQYQATLNVETHNASARLAELEEKFGAREQELERHCADMKLELKDASAKIADMEAQCDKSKQLATQCASLSAELQAVRRGAADTEVRLLAMQRRADAQRGEEMRYAAAKTAELEAQYEQRLADEQRASVEQAAQLRAQREEAAELALGLTTAQGDLKQLRADLEEELGAERQNNEKLEAHARALQAEVAKYHDAACAQAVLQEKIHELTEKLEVQTWATVDAETRAEAECNQLQASEARCSDLWHQNTSLQLAVERERSAVSSLEAQVAALKDQLQQERASTLEEADRIGALEGQAAKYSHELAVIQQQLKQEAEKAIVQESRASSLQHQLEEAAKATQEVQELQQQLQDKTEQAALEAQRARTLQQELQQGADKAARHTQEVDELQKQLRDKTEQALPDALLQQRLEAETAKVLALEGKVADLEQTLTAGIGEVDQARLSSLEQELIAEKDKVAGLEQRVLQEMNKALENQRLAEEHSAKALSLEQMLKDQAEKESTGQQASHPEAAQSPQAAAGTRSTAAMGVSVLHLCNHVQELESQGVLPSFSLQDLEQEILTQTAALAVKDDGRGAPYTHTQGGRTLLPGDPGQSGAEIVGAATHYVCCAPSTPLRDLVGTLMSHCEDSNLSSASTFVWLSSLSSLSNANLHRPREEASEAAEAAAEAATEAASRMRQIGRVWAVLSPCDVASFIGHSWCLAELHLALSMGGEGVELALLSPTQEVQKLGAIVCAEGDFTRKWDSWADSHLAQATSSPLDRALLGSSPLDVVFVFRHLRCWIATLAEGWLRREMLEGSFARDPSRGAAACDAVGWLLREVSLHHRATGLLQDGLQLALGGDRSALLCSPGSGPARCGREELLMSCEDARKSHEQMGTLESTAGMQLLESIGATRWISGDASGAADALQHALRIRRENRSLESAEGAMLLRNLGLVRRMCGDPEGGLEALLEGKRIRECTGSLFGVDGALLMLNLAFAKADRGDNKGAVEAFEDGITLMGAGSASSCERRGDDAEVLPEALENTPCGATLLSAIGVARGNCSDQAGAVSAYNHALAIRQRTKTLITPAGAVLRRNVGVALLALGDADASLEALLESKAIREQTGCLVTYFGANLLGNVANARAQRGDLAAAFRECVEARQLHERAGTLRTPGGRAVLQKLKCLERQLKPPVA